MNRLWVRFSLLFIAGILIMGLSSMIASRLVPRPPVEVGRELQEALQSLPPETWPELQEFARAQMRAGLTSFLIAASIISLVLGIWFSRGLTAPLGELEAAAGAIEAQDLSYRVPVHGSQELQAVATAFNAMAEQLEEAETLRRNLLADVAHELRGPLHLLQGNLQAMLDDVYPMNKEEVARIFDQTCHLTRLVDDLHELAQAEADRVSLYIQDTNPAVLVKETADLFRPEIEAHNINLRIELLGAIPTVNVDAARIRQVVHNLLSNALRHTPPEGQITVTVEHVEDILQICVTDSGDGIQAEHLPYIFDRFYRTDRGRSREKGGTGLGLAIVKAIVEAHDGTVTVHSIGRGQGSTFTVHLPLS
jgi:signal transduction histidine kinase